MAFYSIQHQICNYAGPLFKTQINNLAVFYSFMVKEIINFDNTAFSVKQWIFTNLNSVCKKKK